MKKITEQSLVEMSRNLKTRLNETAANQQDSISSKVGAFGTNAYSTISNSVGDFIQGMRGRKAGKDRPYYNGHDGSYYITDTNGNPEPISPENRPDLVRGDANKKPFYDQVKNDYFWISAADEDVQYPVGDLYKSQHNLPADTGGINTQSNVSKPTTTNGAVEKYPNGTTALEVGTNKPIIWNNGQWGYVK